MADDAEHGPVLLPLEDLSMEQQPRTYRIRLFDKNYEVLTDRKYMAVLSFQPGPGLRATEGDLDALVQSLAFAAGARGAKTLNFHLMVQDWTTNELQCHWPAKSWHEA